MSDKENPLPKPPSRPFGRKKSFEEGRDKEALMADKMAMAMSTGKLDEFLDRELPDNDHARKLAEMMMGMTGMMQMGGPPVTPSPGKEETSKKTGSGRTPEQAPAPKPPEDVINAVQAGDVNSVMEILKREHRKRQGITDEEVEETEQKSGPAPNPAVIEKEIIEQMLKIASDNNLSLDWIFFRALKRYIEEYRRSGNL